MFEQSVSGYVSLAHRCWNFDWEESENFRIYGEQASPEGLGANWRLEVVVKSHGVEDLDLSGHLEFLKGELDHRCLWIDWPMFARSPSTLERVTQELAHRLFARATGGFDWLELRVHENERRSCVARPAMDLLDLRSRQFNLWLTLRGPLANETGLIVSREHITREAKILFQETDRTEGDEGLWVRGIFEKLRAKLPGLVSVRADLGRRHSVEARL